jgi:hypothetical protein
MKKKFLSGITAIAIVAFAVVNVNINSQNDNLLSDLALANVEALAQNGTEIGPAPNYIPWFTGVTLGGIMPLRSCEQACTMQLFARTYTGMSQCAQN